jgi:zinc finger SWIM domain-containing protein 3
LHEGATFASFNELEKVQRAYEQEHFCKLYTRRSRTVESALKRTPNKTFDAKIKFSELEICCIHGGKKFKSTSSGKRPKQM